MANKRDLVSQIAEAKIIEAGGSVDDLGQVTWPNGTRFREDKSIRRGGWGNFTYNCWELPTGIFIAWDSDDRQYRATENP